ncbi:MAG: hypothetical protein KBT69_11970 [Oceanihabitans sp.]|nr:hypothetical protein [Oceanihabitans sp.]
MPLYKNYFLVFLFLIPCITSAQNLECCTSDKEVEEAITGYWKIKNDASKSIYHYWFENGRGNVENVIRTETTGEYKPVEKSHSHIYLKKEDATFILEYIYKYGNWTSVLKKLNATNLTLETNGETTVYYKVQF